MCDFKQTIQIKCSGSDMLPLDSIIEFQGKLKSLSDANMNKLKSSILKHGFIAPIFIWESGWDNKVLDGTQRTATLIKMREDGFDIPLIPVVKIQADNEKDAMAKLLAISSQYGEFNMDFLKDWIQEMDQDLAETIRLVDEEIELDLNIDDEETETIGDDDYEEEVEPITKLGDLWELNGHRLLCGDSTKIEDVEKLMDGQKADMVFTDPPYGVEYQSNMRVKSKRFDVIENDNTFIDFTEIVRDFSNGWVFVWTSWKVQNKWIDIFDLFGYPTNIVVWHKPGGGIGDLKKTFASDYEVALVWNRKAELCGKRIGSVWKINKDSSSKYVHPTQKPVELAVEAIDKTTKQNDVILDLFGGSGFTLLGAEKTNRISRLMELSENYCDVIVNRYIKWCEDNNRECKIKLNGEAWQIQKV